MKQASFRENWSLGFLSRSGTNQAAQLLNMARDLKFQIKEVKVMYYPGSENKFENKYTVTAR